LVGAVDGLFLGFRVARREEFVMLIPTLIGGAVIGAMAGGLVFLLDTPKNSGSINSSTNSNPSSVVGRFLAVTGLLLFWAPIIGLVVSVIGWIANFKTTDWAKICSIIGTVIGLLVSGVVVSAIVFGS